MESARLGAWQSPDKPLFSHADSYALAGLLCNAREAKNLGSMLTSISSNSASTSSALKRAIEWEIAKESPLEALLPVVEEFSSHTSLQRLLEELVRSEQSLENLIGRSCKHALGFEKYMLLSEHPAFQVRLHVWWPQRHPVKEHIHNHRFSFVSGVVLGSITFETYFLADGGQEMDLYVEHLQPHSRSWIFRKERTDRVSANLSATLRSGSAYRLDSRTLHRIHVPSGVLSATLLIETRAIHDSTSVLVATGDDQPQHIERRKLSTSEYLNGIRRVASALEASNPLL